MNRLPPDVEEWLIIARKDWQRVKRNLTQGDYAAAVFFLHLLWTLAE